MCDYLPVTSVPVIKQDAAVDLARLIEKQLGYSYGYIDPVTLRLFIRAYWPRITVLAHTIHEAD